MVNIASRGSFSGKIGFIMAAAASAVGLGNLWRFPYLAAEYGGGIFLLVYLIVVVTFGFTLMITEIAIGRKTGKSALGAFEEFGQKYRFIGILQTIIPLIIVPYYCVITGWVMKYAFDYLTGSGSELSQSDFFGDFTQFSLDGVLDSPFIWFILVAVIVMLAVSRGVEKGVERISKVLMPILLVLLVGLCVYTFTIPGIWDGLKYYLYPDFSHLSASTFLGAIGQLFYSMSLAMGIMIAYGSYMKKDVPIESSVRRISITDTSVAILAGLLIVPVVYVFSNGNMVSGPGLMFETLPSVFGDMFGGNVIGAVFFILVLFAALTSAISLFEALSSIIIDRWGLTRRKAVALVLIAVLVLGSLSCFGYGPLSGIEILGLKFLDFFDFISNSILMPIVAILTCLFVGYILKPKAIIDEVEITGEFKSKKMYVFCIKYLCPVCLVLILITGLLSFLGVYTI